jgi:PKD repeat protein
MTIVTNYVPTGHSGSFSTTSGIYTVAGDLTTDAENDIVTMKGSVTVTSSSAKVATFNLYFIDDDNVNQDAIMAAVKAVRSAIDADLNSNS